MARYQAILAYDGSGFAGSQTQANSRTVQGELERALRDPLREKFVWRVWPDVNGDALQQNAALLLGTHDFAAFGSAPTPAPRGTTVRTVTQSEWRQMPDGEWQFEVSADAFLYRMVRRLVFAQVSTALGRSSFEDIQRALSGQEKFLPAGLAPAHGLTLVEVMYGSKDPI